MDKKRKRLGLIFGTDKQWIAGSYYLMNVVHALNSLPDAEKPYIVFLTNSENEATVRSLNYPYYNIKNPYKTKRTYVEAFINKIVKYFVGRDTIIKKISRKHIDYLFPASFDNAYELAPNKIFWIPDFQHHYYPNFFKADELHLRKTIFNQIAENPNSNLVLSSLDALNDFKQFYPQAIKNIELKNLFILLPISFGSIKTIELFWKP